MLVFRGTHGHEVPMGQVCECMCLPAVSTGLDQMASKGPVGRLRGSGVWARVPGGERGCANTWGFHNSVCACEPGECHIYAYTGHLQTLPDQEEEETQLSVIMSVIRCC